MDFCHEKKRQVNEVIGSAIRGLALHISTVKTAGMTYLLEKALLTSQDKGIIREFFNKQFPKLADELCKTHFRIVQTFVVDTFEKMCNQYPSGFELIEFCKKLIALNQEMYEKVDNRFSTVSISLNIKIENDVTYTPGDLSLIADAGVKDSEDQHRLAWVHAYNSTHSSSSIYVTTDYEHILSNKEALVKLGIYCEEPLWAIDLYKDLTKTQATKVDSQVPKTLTPASPTSS